MVLPSDTARTAYFESLVSSTPHWNRRMPIIPALVAIRDLVTFSVRFSSGCSRPEWQVIPMLDLLSTAAGISKIEFRRVATTSQANVGAPDRQVGPIAAVADYTPEY